MNKFIYVFSKEDKEKLIKRGFKLLKNDERNSIFIFALNMSDKFTFELFDDLGKYSLSNTLTF